MKIANPTCRCQIPLLTGLLFSPLLSAATLYWDTNGATPGSGDTGGDWDVGTNWTTDAPGSIATTGWLDGESAVFSAGTDGTSQRAVTITGTVETPSILLEESGLVNLQGGTLDIAGGSTFDTSAAGNGGGRSMTWSSNITGTGDLTLAVNGNTSDTGGGSNTMFNLTGSNDFVGDVIITSGVVRSTANLGDAANKVILSGGGIVDPNLNTNFSRDIEVPSGQTGVYRTYGGVGNGILSGAITGAGTLKHTDGGTISFTGDGSAFTGVIDSTRGAVRVSSNDWSGTTFSNSDGNRLTFDAGGTTSIDAYQGDRDVFIEAGNRVDVLSGNFSVVSGAGNNNFWIQPVSGGGTLTSSSGTLTCNWPLGGDKAIRVAIEDFDGSTPLMVVKNGAGDLGRFGTNANTYTGGTIVNEGRIGAIGTAAFGSGAVTINADDVTGVGGQTFLSASGIFANDFAIEGIGSTEGAGNLGAIRFANNTISGDITVHPNGARLVGYNGQSGTHAGSLLGSGELEINFDTNPLANGLITLSGDASSFTGDFLVSGGTLDLGEQTVVGGLTVVDGATFASETSFGGDIVLGGTTGANLLGDAATAAVLATAGNLTLNGVVEVTLNNMAAGTIPVMTYGGTLTGDASNLTLAGGVAGLRPGSGFDVSTPGTVSFVSASTNLIWTGATSDDWDLATTQNWTNPTPAADFFYAGDAVTFDDSGAGFPNVVLVGDMKPASVVVNSSLGNDYTFDSSSNNWISGITSIVKQGASTLTLAGPMDYSGGTLISGGMVVMTDPLSLGQEDVDTGTVVVESGGTLDLNGTTDGYYGVTIAGTGSSGQGALINDGPSKSNAWRQTPNIELSADASIGGTGDFYQIGGGYAANTMTLNGHALTKVGSNTFFWNNTTVTAGSVRISEGRISQFNRPTNASAVAVTLDDVAGVTLDIGSQNMSVGSLTGGGGTGGEVSLGGGSATLTVGTASGTTTFSGVISGSGNLVKSGGSVQILSGVNTFTGSTTVSGGLLSLTHGNSLSDSAELNINGGAKLDLNFSGVELVQALNDDGTPLADGLYGASGSGADIINDDLFTGTGQLFVGPTPYDLWAGGTFANPPFSDTDGASNPDGDSLSNLLEFAFGTDPTSPDSNALSWDGVNPAVGGSPVVDVSFPGGGGVDFKARFLRRKDHGTIGSASYAWEFSSDLTDWESSDGSPGWLVPPVDLADDASGDYDLVEVPYPFFLDNGKKARFFRVSVTGP